MNRSFRCVCGQPLFFRNTQCIRCKRQLGYRPDAGSLDALEPGETPGSFVLAGGGADAPGTFVRCANLATPAACNWLAPLPAGETADAKRYCVACRLNRTVPDWSIDRNAENWRRIELAKRRLVSTLLALKLPLRSRLHDDRVRGLAFDFLSPSAGPASVLTGHANGVITVNIDEADDPTREAIRAQFHEPYRTVLGHLRHEVGHYYWDRLVAGTEWLPRFRELFGDETANYAAALQRHYRQGPTPGWQARHISGYASAHPWEDWAESWAHYLHMIDALDTAGSYGLNLAGAEFDNGGGRDDAVVLTTDATEAPVSEFTRLFGDWLKLTQVLNELSGSMGEKDFYPFVVGTVARRKLEFVHRVIAQHRESAAAA